VAEGQARGEGTAEASGRTSSETSLAAQEGPDPSRPSRCTGGCDHGTCNEELGECFCHVAYTGPTCSAPAFPACHLAPGYWTPCYALTTCECIQQCQTLRLGGCHPSASGANARMAPLSLISQRCALHSLAVLPATRAPTQAVLPVVMLAVTRVLYRAATQCFRGRRPDGTPITNRTEVCPPPTHRPPSHWDSYLTIQ